MQCLPQISQRDYPSTSKSMFFINQHSRETEQKKKKREGRWRGWTGGGRLGEEGMEGGREGGRERLILKNWPTPFGEVTSSSPKSIRQATKLETQERVDGLQSKV